jgi:tetratricopeptide (TPR) repeat protein
MTMLSRLLNRAIELGEAGENEDARRVLRAILDADPHQEAAWAHYVRLLPTVDERIQALEQFLQVEPGNPWAQRLMLALRQQRQRAAEPVPPRPARSRLGYYAMLAVLACCLSCLLLGIVYVRQEVLDRWQEQYSGLVRERDDLQEAYDGLQAGYGSLAGEYASLQDGQSSLQAESASLHNEYALLQRQLDLVGEQSTGQASLPITPPHIFVHDREVEIAFETLDGSTEFWTVPFESLEWSILAGERQRKDPDWLRLRTNTSGGIRRIQDYRPYVNPGPFEGVMADLYAEAEDDEAFIREVWHVVTQLSPYSSDLEDTPRFPLETLLAGGGDCEDTSILLASMLKAAPVDWEIELVYMDLDHPEEPEEANHVVVQVDTGTRSYVIETTNPQEMLPFEQIRGWFFQVGDKP